MKIICRLLIAGWLFSQCSTPESPSNKVASAEDASTADSTGYFPVTTFLQTQLNELDSLKGTILQIAGSGDKGDSTWITAKELRPLLLPFIEDTIDKYNLQQWFRENRFNDQSTESITLTYLPVINPLPPSIRLRRWDVYVQPDNGQLKMVYLNRIISRSSDTLSQQLIWKTGRWAKIITKGTGNSSQPAALQEIKWIWGSNF